jgi:hypothetical protein
MHEEHFLSKSSFSLKLALLCSLRHVWLRLLGNTETLDVEEILSGAMMLYLISETGRTQHPKSKPGALYRLGAEGWSGCLISLFFIYRYTGVVDWHGTIYGMIA